MMLSNTKRQIPSMSSGSCPRTSGAIVPCSAPLLPGILSTVSPSPIMPVSVWTRTTIRRGYSGHWSVSIAVIFMGSFQRSAISGQPNTKSCSYTAIFSVALSLCCSVLNLYLCVSLRRRAVSTRPCSFALTLFAFVSPVRLTLLLGERLNTLEIIAVRYLLEMLLALVVVDLDTQDGQFLLGLVQLVLHLLEAARIVDSDGGLLRESGCQCSRRLVEQPGQHAVVRINHAYCFPA